MSVTRSKDVPSFGPPIPEGVTFPKSSVFRDFLLAKVINAENAAHKSHKFRAMATRTRQEYLRDLAERHTTSTPIDPSGKFPFISLAHKKKEKSRPYGGAELRSLGAVTWPVHTEDHSTGGEIEALLAISNDFVILLDQEAKAVVFNCATKDVISWTLSSPASLRIFYERGESVSLRSISNNTEDFKEVVKRLEVRRYTQLRHGSQVYLDILEKCTTSNVYLEVIYQIIITKAGKVHIHDPTTAGHSLPNLFGN